MEVNLRRSGAIEASLLAPAKEASTLAIFESIVSGDSIALRACRADADSTRQAGVELVVVDASQGESSLATFVGGITKIVVIHGLNGSLVIGRARSSVCGLEARLGRACWDAGARWEVNLRRSGAIEASLLAPAEEASTLAIFESVVSGDCIALRACRADADSTGQARVEFVVVDASQRERSLTTFVGGIAKIIVIHGLNGGLVIRRARSR